VDGGVGGLGEGAGRRGVRRASQAPGWEFGVLRGDTE